MGLVGGPAWAALDSAGSIGAVGIGYCPSRVLPAPVVDGEAMAAEPRKVVFWPFGFGFLPMGSEAKTGGGVGALGATTWAGDDGVIECLYEMYGGPEPGVSTPEAKPALVAESAPAPHQSVEATTGQR